MNLSQIITQARRITQDLSPNSYQNSDEELIEYANEALIEACRNSRILKSADISKGEKKSFSTLLVSGTSGVLSAITIDGVNIITNPVNYTTNDVITCALISNEINDTGLFIAIPTNNQIRLEPVDGKGSYYNNIVPIITQTSPFLSATSFVGGVDGFLKIQLKRGVKEYKISDKILKINSFTLGDDDKPLCVMNYNDVSDVRRKQYNKLGEVKYIMYGMSNDSIYVANLPENKDYIKISAYHLPVNKLKNNSDIPEIPEQYHSKLVHYILYKIYMKNDIEVDEKEIAMFYFNEFTKEFNDNQFAAASNRSDLYSFFNDK